MLALRQDRTPLDARWRCLVAVVGGVALLAISELAGLPPAALLADAVLGICALILGTAIVRLTAHR